MVDAPTRWPNWTSSPWILWYPQVGFSVAMRWINPATVSSMGGRASDAVWIRPLFGDQATMPAQHRAWGDQAVCS
jgi:hypothetical protein